MVSRGYIYVATAVAFAVVVSSISDRFLVLQFFVLTALLAIVAVDSILRVDEGVYAENEQPVIRSRVTHYARIGGVKDSGRLIRTASNPFERALLHSSEWPSLSAGELRGLAGRVPEEWDEPIVSPQKTWR